MNREEQTDSNQIEAPWNVKLIRIIRGRNLSIKNLFIKCLVVFVMFIYKLLQNIIDFFSLFTPSIFTR